MMSFVSYAEHKLGNCETQSFTAVYLISPISPDIEQYVMLFILLKLSNHPLEPLKSVFQVAMQSHFV